MFYPPFLVLYYYIVLSTRIETDFPEAFLNQRYIRKCRTTRNPVPRLHIQPEAPQSDCPFNAHHNINGYNVEAVPITISNFNNKCQMIICDAGFGPKAVSLNITTGK